jgi:hypothetical protein
VASAALPSTVVVVAHYVDEVQIAALRNVKLGIEGILNWWVGLRGELGDVVAYVGGPEARTHGGSHQQAERTELCLQFPHQTCQVCLEIVQKMKRWV